MSIAHASLTIIRIHPDSSISVLSIGDVGHLPPSLESWGTDSDPQLTVFPRAPRAIEPGRPELGLEDMQASAPALHLETSAPLLRRTSDSVRSAWLFIQ